MKPKPLIATITEERVAQLMNEAHEDICSGTTSEWRAAADFWQAKYIRLHQRVMSAATKVATELMDAANPPIKNQAGFFHDINPEFAKDPAKAGRKAGNALRKYWDRTCP